MAGIERLTIAIPSEMAALVKAAVDSGEYASASEVLRDALRSWKYERLSRLNEDEQIRRNIALGLQDLKEGKTSTAEEVLTRLERKYSGMA